MITSGVAAYQNSTNLLTGDSNLVQEAVASQETVGANTDAGTAAVAEEGDQVTLSPAVDEARLKESLGLPPTGKVTRQDLVARIQADQAGVQQALQEKLTELGLDPKTQITLSQGTDGQIKVDGAGSNNAALAKSLNDDADFSQIFARLATNSKFLSFPAQMLAAGFSTNLSDYLDGNSADANLATLLKQYSSLKNSSDAFASLLSLSSNSGNPFTFTSNAEQSQTPAGAAARDE